MIQFLNTYGSNITLVIAILGFLITVIVQWDKISGAIRKLVESLDKASLFLFNAVAVAISGLVAGSLYWIFIDYLVLGKLDGPAISADVISGAGWGILPALVAAWGKSSGAATAQSILAGVILLLLQAPADQILVKADVLKTDVFALIWLSISISIFCGLAGYRTRVFLETISRGQAR